MNWRLHKRTARDNRAPSAISLEDYETLTVVEGLSREEVVRTWITNPGNFEDLRDDNFAQIGDVLENIDNEKYLILTPQGFWAEIQVFD